MKNNLMKNLNIELENELQAAENFLTRVNHDFIKKTSKDESNTQNTIFSINHDPEQDNKKNDEKSDILSKFRKKLKTIGFPEIGLINFPSEEDKEKTIIFLDYLLHKKNNENEERIYFKKQLELLNEKLQSSQNENSKLEKTLLSFREEMKKNDKEKRESENKISKIKEICDKQVADMKLQINKMDKKLNILLVDKKSLEEKLNKMSDNYQKILNKGKPINNIEMIENLKKNDILKSLSKIKGAEKLVETFKFGFNESVRELIFEISALKNFIQEINRDIISKKGDGRILDIDDNLLNMPFLDTLSKIKHILKFNLDNMSYTKHEIDISELEETRIVFDQDEIEHESKNEVVEKDYLDELELLKSKWVKTLMK